MNIFDQITTEAHNVAMQLCEAANLQKGDIVVIGCSSSEVLGNQIGQGSSPQVADALYKGLSEVFDTRGIFMAAQCCEHLNRAIVIEKNALFRPDIVNVVPQPKAGGSFGTCCYQNFVNPIVVEHIQADAGIDIGDTLIGMHLKPVAVPLRIEQKKIGSAHIVTARTRPKFIGGCRAVYDESML